MIRHCGITDEQLFEFADGADSGLEDHVAGCEDCQAFLAELWEGELRASIAEPVLRQIRLEQFLIEVARTAGAVAGRMGRAAAAFTMGTDQGWGIDGPAG
jgi:hypothetical protein